MDLGELLVAFMTEDVNYDICTVKGAILSPYIHLLGADARLGSSDDDDCLIRSGGGVKIRVSPAEHVSITPYLGLDWICWSSAHRGTGFVAGVNVGLVLPGSE